MKAKAHVVKVPLVSRGVQRPPHCLFIRTACATSPPSLPLALRAGVRAGVRAGLIYPGQPKELEEQGGRELQVL